MSKLIVENLVRVLDGAHHLQQGNLAHRVTVTVQDEIGKLATAFNQMAETLQAAENTQQASLKTQQAQAAELNGVMNAIGSSQAMAEFSLDGTVLAANKNFLHITGYSLDEIKGRHHRMFCEALHVDSGDYATFWQKLNRGEFESSAYRRLGKGGKEIWIQASYI